ncbi:hypothetical protein [Spirochaeta isovalerica]|uniref:Chromosome segregation ATPase n=1 Tax=Spirochaeta isovalerica TaxID=150 RepID=A0A841RF38_9SPIO|nr:hypothetical protein [Spirochaeta isovalerica]MBB6480972.1 chromosome segregation ATPase [Spirochaeta isovalerica]
MKQRSIALLCLLLAGVYSIGAQADSNYVDVKETNEEIARLQRTNDNHRTIIETNAERKAFLENRIQTSESRLEKIAENLAYASETNLELNSISRETKDRETLDRLDSSRAELKSVMWILRTEQTRLTEQVASDKDEVEFLTNDSARREAIVARNEELIAEKQKAVSDTEAKINEVSTKLDSIIGELESLREEVTTDGN